MFSTWRTLRKIGRRLRLFALTKQLNNRRPINLFNYLHACICKLPVLIVTGATSSGFEGSVLMSRSVVPELSKTRRYSRSTPPPGSPRSSACPKKLTVPKSALLPPTPVSVPVPWNSMKLKGVTGEVEPLTPGTLPQSTT